MRTGLDAPIDPSLEHARLHLPEGLSTANPLGFAALLREISGRPLPSDLPWLTPALLLSHPPVAALCKVPQSQPGAILVQDYHSIDIAGPLVATAPIDAELGRGLRDNAFTLITRLNLPNATILQRSDMRFVPPQGLATAKGIAPPAPAQHWCQITAQMVADYLALSGDINPIHRDAAHARALGLSAPVIPGMLLVALVEPMLDDPLPLHSIRCRFMRPVPLDATVDAMVGFALVQRPTGRRAFVLHNDEAIAVVDLRLSQQ